MRAGSPFNRVERVRRRDGTLALVVEFFSGKYRMWMSRPVPPVAILAVLLAVAGSCARLPLPGNPACCAAPCIDNCANGTAAEDPKCWVGPCEPRQHGEGEGE